MLARSFLSAKELNIQEWEHKGLIKVLGMLERGELRHSYTEEKKFGFNMGTTAMVAEGCGTIACIGGWAYLLTHKGHQEEPANVYVNSWSSFHVDPDAPNNHLNALYFPPEVLAGKKVDYFEITVEQAAQALNNFLTTGKPDWEEVLR